MMKKEGLWLQNQNSERTKGNDSNLNKSKNKNYGGTSKAKVESHVVACYMN
jgi:hypothetical protein